MSKLNYNAQGYDDLAGFQDGLAHAVMTGESHLRGYLEDTSQKDRIRIYRNNRLSSIVEALASDYPAVKRLVGTEFLRAAACAFADEHPPTERSLTLYGGDFPEFMENLPNLSSVPYLGDVARLERAYIESVFEADVPPLTPHALATADETQLASLTLSLHPSVRIVVSSWPAREIWQANLKEDAERVPQFIQESWYATMLWRMSEGVVHRELETDEFLFLNMIDAQRSIGEALNQAAQGESQEPVISFFSEMLATGVFCSPNDIP